MKPQFTNGRSEQRAWLETCTLLDQSHHLATVDTALAEPGTEVAVIWGENPVSAKPAVEPHVQVEIRATIAPCPYDARDTYWSG